jgi:hypothetical protein
MTFKTRSKEYKDSNKSVILRVPIEFDRCGKRNQNPQITILKTPKKCAF